ncbi:MAG: hypothetical protein R6U37_03285 [Dehalococcoidia bacterium]
MAVEPAGADVASARISPDYKISPKPEGEKPDDGLITGIIAGVDYEIEFTLDIAKGMEGKNLVLSTQMERSGDRCWELETRDYEGVDTGSWQPGQHSISFNAVAGTPTFKLTGYVPGDMVATQLLNPVSGTITLHRPGTLALLSLSLESGEVLQSIDAEAVDDAIIRYNDKKDDRSEALGENSDLAEEIEELAEMGYMEQATALLDTLPDAGWESDSGASSTILYIVAAVLAVIAVLAIVFLLRIRGTMEFMKQRASDQADKLDIVESRIHKLGEKSLTGDVAQIRDILKEMGRR